MYALLAKNRSKEKALSFVKKIRFDYLKVTAKNLQFSKLLNLERLTCYLEIFSFFFGFMHFYYLKNSNVCIRILDKLNGTSKL